MPDSTEVSGRHGVLAVADFGYMGGGSISVADVLDGEMVSDKVSMSSEKNTFGVMAIGSEVWERVDVAV